jgi:hypothetical protein
MFTNSKIAIAAALILGTASAALAGSAANTRKASALAGGSYAQVNVRPSPNAGPAPAGALRPLTQFEINWFDYQNHGTSD